MAKQVDSSNIGTLLQGVFTKIKNAFWAKDSTSQLSIDSTPTANSNNLVKSGGVKAYVDGKTGDLTDLDTTDKSSLVAAINEAASSGGTNPLPTGGSAGQVLAKASAADYDVEWGNIPSGGGGALPAGGTKGQTLVKQSAIDGDATWVLRDENKELIIDQTFNFDKLQPTAYDSVTGYYTVDAFPSWVTAGDGGTFRACLNVVLFSNISAVPYPRDNAASICDLTRVDSTHFSIASGQAPSGTPNPAAFFFTPTFNGGITIPRVLNAKTKYRMIVENGASYPCYYTPIFITTRTQHDLFTSFPMPLSVYGDVYGPRILQSNWEIEFTLDTTTSTTYIIAHYVKRSAVVRTKASGNPLYFEPMTVGYGDNRYNSWQVGNSNDFYLATSAASIEWVHEGTRVRVYKIG